MRKWQFFFVISAFLVLLCSCSAKNDSTTDVAGANRYFLSIMDAETGAFTETVNTLQTDEKLNVEFLVKKVGERLQTDATPVEVSIEEDRIVIVLADNALILQADSVKLKTAFFTSVAKTIASNAKFNVSWDKEFIEYRANGQACYIYQFENEKLAELRK